MSAQPYPETNRPVVVYADHDPDGRAAFVQACGADHEVVACDDASSALVALDMREVAVLVTVLHIPGLTGEDLLRITRDIYPRTVRIAIGNNDDPGQLARVSEDGLVASSLVAPWQASELVAVVRSACARWTPPDDPAPKSRSLLHDIRSVLMSVLANAEYLEGIAADAPAFAVALERVTLNPRTHHDLRRLLEELLPLARDMTTATRDLKQLIDRLAD